MHAPYDNQRKAGDRNERKGSLGFLILPLVVALVLIVLATIHPKAGIWISQAVQAEFGGSGIAEDMPVQTAQPGMVVPMLTVRAE